MVSSAVLAATVLSWPSTVPQDTMNEVTRLIGKRFEVQHCVRGGEVECQSDALWIQFQLVPEHWTRKPLAVAERKSNTIAIFPNEVLKHTKLQANDVWFKIALGRVAAHEVVHLLVRDRDHWGNGLMKSHQTREQLTALQLLPLAD